MKRLIYFSFLGYVVSAVLNFLAMLRRPFMVYGYYSRCDRKFYRFVRISSSTVINSPERLRIADDVWIWHHSVIDASNGVSIGEGCQIGAFVGVFTHSSHNAIRLHGKQYIHTPIDERIGYVKGAVEIGAYVFIGTGSLIFPGTTIGKGSLVLAGSHVKGNIPPYSVVSGNPAKVIAQVGQMDRMYLKDARVKKDYFSPELWAEMEEKYLNKK